MSKGAELSVADGHLRLKAGGQDERRPLDDASVAVLKTLTKRYAALVERPDPAGLLVVGRGLRQWLDGPGGWWVHLDKVVPLVLEVQGPSQPDQAAWAVLRAPWEVLADDKGFLAADGTVRYAPMRRLGPAGEAEPLDDHRLAIAFMAAAPRGADELGHEAEEQAIMDVAGGLDLEVEDSGNARQLGLRMARIDPPLPVLHLSCHGHNAWRIGEAEDAPDEPVLLLEDPEGGRAPTTADVLLEHLDPYRPRLLFLSACLTARAGEEKEDNVAHSLATTLVRAGMPAVMGWNGSVADVAATAFARWFYDGLARKQTPAVAAGAARRKLLNGEGRVAGTTDHKEDAGGPDALERIFGASTEALQRDWHLAQLWVGSDGGGPVVGGERKRSLLGADHGHKVLLSKKDSGSEVASAAMFVGRRRDLQDCLKVLRKDDHGGVLIHGMGHLGKSSLAARLASRRPDLKLVVLYKDYDAGSVVEALKGALEDHPPARELLQAQRTAVLDEVKHGRADKLHDLLVDLLNGPCRQAADGRPLLLLIDDLERILEENPAGGRHRVKNEARPVLAAILQAFAPERSESRLVLTSRVPFTLERGGSDLADRLWPLPLGGLKPAEQRKLTLRQMLSAQGSGLPADELADRLRLVKRAQAVSSGHPGLQDLIGQGLVLNRKVDLATAEAAVLEMERYLQEAVEPESQKVRDYLENLAIGQLLDLAGPHNRELLRAGLLFDLPVPIAAMEAFTQKIDGDPQRLLDLGLLEPFEDLVRSGTRAVAVSGLVRPRLQPLDDREATALAALAVKPLFEAWGGAGGRARRPNFADLALTRLGLRAQKANVVAACAADAVRALAGISYGEAATLGQDAIALLDREKMSPPIRLMSQVADALAGNGQGDDADAVLTRATTALEGTKATDQRLDPGEAGVLLMNRADRLMRKGDLDDAKPLFEEAAELVASLGKAGERDAAVARGRIADILQARGQLDEALRIRQEEQLPVFDRLGDVRSKAVTMGKMADILQARGQLDEALRIRQEEQLPVFDRLGDVRSKAVTMGQIADILQARGQLDEALRIRQEEELPVYDRLGDVRSKAVTMGKIADILQARGQLDEALRIRQEEQLPVYDRLGDVRSKAVTLFKIAQALMDEGSERQGAGQRIYDCLAESFAINREVREPQGVGHVGMLLCQVLAAGGHPKEALDVLAQSEEAFRILGNDEALQHLAQLREAIQGMLPGS